MTMWCIIQIGSQQFKVSKNDVIEAERVNGVDGEFEIKQVLVYSDGNDVKFGTPTVPGVTVKAKVEEEYKADKVYAFKFRRRKNSKSVRGHRQIKNAVRILDIAAK